MVNSQRRRRPLHMDTDDPRSRHVRALNHPRLVSPLFLPLQHMHNPQPANNGTQKPQRNELLPPILPHQQPSLRWPPSSSHARRHKAPNGRHARPRPPGNHPPCNPDGSLPNNNGNIVITSTESGSGRTRTPAAGSLASSSPPPRVRRPHRRRLLPPGRVQERK